MRCSGEGALVLAIRAAVGAARMVSHVRAENGLLFHCRQHIFPHSNLIRDEADGAITEDLIHPAARVSIEAYK